jgi:EmrB/QacA subfamily drug resistance transporter
MSNKTVPDDKKALGTLLCVSVPSFMINLDSNIVAVSLPAISRSLHADFTAVEWVISAYTLAFASLVLPAGTLADRYGRKKLLLLGLGLFTVASFICGAAPNLAVLNGARALQGIGAALQLSAALAILSHRFHGAARAHAFAFWGAVIGIAITLGPVAGGLITQYFGWEWSFYINIPIGLAIGLLVVVEIKESRDPEAGRLDVLGLLCFSTFLFVLTFALIGGNHKGWRSAEILAEFALAALLFVMFIIVELKHERPMLDLTFFRKPTFVGANIAGFAYAAFLLTMLTYLPLYFQGALGYSAGAAGLLMLPVAFPLFIIPRVVVGMLSHRATGRDLLALGLGILSVGLLLMGIAAPYFRYEWMLGGMLLSGIGAGILNGETAKVGVSAIPPARAGMASGMSGTIRFSGIVVGFAALGAILVSQVSSVVAADPVAARLSNLPEFARNVAAGNIGLATSSQSFAFEAALRGFGIGYRTIFLVACVGALVSAAACWWLVRPEDTPAVRREKR